jgi:hypothetical protein
MIAWPSEAEVEVWILAVRASIMCRSLAPAHTR